MAEKGDIARKLEEAKRMLNNALENAVRRHENQGKPIELDMNFVEEPDSGSRRVKEEFPGLYEEITRLIDDFMQRPEVQESGMTIYKLHAADSDGDGSVAVNVQYEYAVDAGMRGSARDAVGGTG